MRIFIGIALSQKDKQQLEKIQKTVIEKSEGGRFSQPDTFHLTLKFIGEIDPVTLKEITKVLTKIAGEETSFSMVLQGFGAFQKGHTCIPWIGVQEGAENLTKLQEKIETALREAGFKEEGRTFHPHMTFGRKVRLSSSNQSFLAEALKDHILPIHVNSIALMESTRRMGKLIYPVIEEFTLEK